MTISGDTMIEVVLKPRFGVQELIDQYSDGKLTYLELEKAIGASQ